MNAVSSELHNCIQEFNIYCITLVGVLEFPIIYILFLCMKKNHDFNFKKLYRYIFYLISKMICCWLVENCVVENVNFFLVKLETLNAKW